MAEDVLRTWFPFQQTMNSSLSPGFFTQYDSQVEIYPDSGGTTVLYLSSVVGEIAELVDGLNGDTLDGQFHDLTTAKVRKVELVSSSNQVVTDPVNAVKVVATHWSGLTEEFAIIDLNPNGQPSYAGRLTTRTHTTGRQLQVAYKTWTSAEIQESPSRNVIIECFGVISARKSSAIDST